MSQIKVLIMGVTGMLGHTLFSNFSHYHDFEAYATARNKYALQSWFSQDCLPKIISEVYVENLESIAVCLSELRPHVVVNCIGIIKQLPSAQDALKTITVNSLFPHRLALMCKTIGARLIHISTDCVFSGIKGNYREDDPPDPLDLYGRTKLLGEVFYPNCLTIRTSIIGHELKGNNGLVEWFLAQEGTVKGFKKAIYSGITTLELAHILRNIVIPNPDLQGLYQISTEPISKYELLNMLAGVYDKQIVIEPDDSIRIDRSLNSIKFKEATGYVPPSWLKLINNMYRDFITAPHYKNRLHGGN